MGQDELAQRAQMQALRRAASGTLASSSALKVACVHQQGSLVGWPVSRACSIAHRLGWPHNGQQLASGLEWAVAYAAVWVFMRAVGKRWYMLHGVLQCHAANNVFVSIVSDS